MEEFLWSELCSFLLFIIVSFGLLMTIQSRVVLLENI